MYTVEDVVTVWASGDVVACVHARCRPAFNIGSAPNGGYLNALCISALQASLQGHPHPCVSTTYPNATENIPLLIHFSPPTLPFLSSASPFELYIKYN